jgi:hypothetical protein
MWISLTARRPIAVALLSVLMLTAVTGPRSVLATILPHCPAYDNILTKYREYSDWRRTLLDTVYRLPLSYAPPYMADTSRAGFSRGHLVRHQLLDDLRALGAAARGAGARALTSSRPTAAARRRKPRSTTG